MIEFKVGTEADFYGVDSCSFKLDDTVFRAVEDEDDGYRSMLSEVQPVEDATGLIFFQQPVARIRVEDANAEDSRTGEGFEGYKLVDAVDGHVWLLIGTDNADDYYPCFTFEYTPKVAP